MSIVERALQKHASSGGRVERVRAQESPLPAALAAAAAHAARTLAAPPPLRSIVVDQERLRAHNILIGRDLHDRTRDEFRRIKWPVLNAASARDGRVEPCGPLLLVTSAVPGEGKTFAAINLALSVASESEGGALLVDADLARPQVTHLFGLEDAPGLTDMLADSSIQVADVTIGTDVSGLRLIPAGRPHALAPELIASRRMDEVATRLRASYEGSLVLFDSPPLLANNTAQVLSHYVGQILLVVRANETPRSDIAEALTLLSKGKPVNAVLNQTSPSDFGQYGGY